MTEYFVILTVERAAGPGQFQQTTIYRTPTVKADATRGELYQWAFQQLPPEMRNAVTVFFSAEPNQIGGAS